MKHRISPFLFFITYTPIHYHSDFHAMLISFNQEHFTHKIMQIGGEWKCKLQPISVSLNSLNCLKTCILQQCNAFPCYEQFYGFQSNKKQLSICQDKIRVFQSVYLNFRDLQISDNCDFLEIMSASEYCLQYILNNACLTTSLTIR